MNSEQLEIVKRVKDLYLRYGIKSVTMDDVARELGASKKTLYQYFSDKSELVEAVINLEISIKEEAIEELFSKEMNAIEEMYHIHKMLDNMSQSHNHVVDYDLKKYYPSIYQHIINVKRDKVYSIWKRNIEKGKTEGFYRTEVNTEIISKTNLLRFESTVDTCIFSSEELMSQDFFTEILIYHIRGIGTAKGIEKMEELLKNK